jgi:hypothetical protein
MCWRKRRDDRLIVIVDIGSKNLFLSPLLSISVLDFDDSNPLLFDHFVSCQPALAVLKTLVCVFGSRLVQ